jgi:hypothetical protein
MSQEQRFSWLVGWLGGAAGRGGDMQWQKRLSPVIKGQVTVPSTLCQMVSVHRQTVLDQGNRDEKESSMISSPYRMELYSVPTRHAPVPQPFEAEQDQQSWNKK